jgi:hypothetical protein
MRILMILAITMAEVAALVWGALITCATTWQPDVSMLVAATMKRLERSP